MTRRLILIRHAKAEASGVDSERPLASSGERDARAIGEWLRKAGVTSGLAVVSTARRARQTWEIAAQELGGDVTATHDGRIYENSVSDLLAVVRETPDETDTLMLVGHNPSVHALASGLDDGHGNKRAAKEIATKFPTSGVAVLEVPGSWSLLVPGSASLVSFAAPRAGSTAAFAAFRSAGGV